MYSQIVERTPSVYFKFDDQSHRNFSKSSFALDYSISNQKQVLSNNRFNKLRTNNKTTLKQPTHNKMHDFSPQHALITTDVQESNKNLLEQEDEFMALHRCHKVSQSIRKQNKLKTQDFFEEFDKKYSFTFEQDDIRTHEFIPEAEYEGGSKISRGFLDFQEFQVEQTMKLIEIDSKKQLTQTQSNNSNEQMTGSNIVSFIKTSQNMFVSSEMTVINDENQKTEKKPAKTKFSNETSKQLSSNKQNCHKNDQAEFQEVISFGPTAQSNKPKKYKPTSSRNFITKDFQNNSSLLQKSKPIIDPKRRVPFKNIQNLINKHSKGEARSQTRKKPIINTDLLISTINRAQKNQIKQTNTVWSNPINTKSSSLDSTFNYDNMFKTNAFRETLKSTTLENWKKKYHKKIENLGDKKTVCKKKKDPNIFQNLFIRA